MIEDSIHLFGEFTLDLARGCLTQSGRPVHLRPQSYAVLKYLAENKGSLISKDKLIETVWQGRAVTDGSLGKCIEEVREAIGPEARPYLRNVRGRGYIFDNGPERAGPAGMPAVEELHTRSEDESVPPPVSAAPPSGISSRIVKNRTAIGAVCFLAIAAVAFGYRWFHSPVHPPPITSIAVLPFRNESGNPDLDYISDGITESLIGSLARLPRLSIKSHSSVLRYKGKTVEPAQAAAELSVQAVLAGRIVQHGDDLTIYLSLVDAGAGDHLWGEQYHRQVTDLASLQTEMVREVSEKLRLRLTRAEQQELTKGSTQNGDAYRAYLKGLYYWSKSPAPGYEKAREYFQQAIDIDPTYALGYAGLSHFYGFASATGMIRPAENWPRSEAAVNRALALDDTLAETYNALAGIQLYFHHDWPAAERSFRRGIELNPNSAEVHHHYGRCLVLFGRDEEALVELRRAVELDPLSLAYSLNLARHFFFVRQYGRAIEQFRQTLELEPGFAAAHEWLGYVYEKAGMRDEAVAEWSRALTLSGQTSDAGDLARIYPASGFDAALLALEQSRVHKLDERVKRGEYVPAAAYATAYAHMGDRQRTLAWLNKAVDEPMRFALEFNVNPLFDGVRDHSQFADLLRRVGVSLVQIH
jgi:TolB-like protein/DNA-binding winged helix-turn-helix (wHTH) protein/Tfp pilus assembly protein PilF